MATYSLPNSADCCESDGTLKCPEDTCGECFSCVEFFPCVAYDGSGQLQYCSATLKRDSNGNPVLDGPPGSEECAYILDCGFSPIDYVLRSMFTISTRCCPYDFDDGDEYYVYFSYCDPDAEWVDSNSPYYFATYTTIPFMLLWEQAECCFIDRFTNFDGSAGVRKYCPLTGEYSENGVVWVDPYADMLGTPSDSRVHPNFIEYEWWENVDAHVLVTDDPTFGGTENVNINCIPQQ